MTGRSARHPIIAVVVLSALVVACGPVAPPKTRPSRPSSSPVATPSAAQLKPVLRGLLDRSGPPPSGYAGVLAGFVVNVRWSDLQPVQGGPISSDNAIDQALATVRSLNSGNHTQLGLKIRVFAGIDAPDWAKQIGGPPIPVTNPQNGATGTIGRFWTEPFGQAYAKLESLLAAGYDAVPEIREVTVSRCTTFYDEPFIRDTSDSSSVQALLGAGFTLAADATCHQEEVAAHVVWRHTRSDLALNPYQVINPDGSASSNEGFTESMMLYCRHVLGQACVLENNSIRFPVQAGYEPMYQAMSALGQPISFQTATAERIGDLQATLGFAVTSGANSVELPGGYPALATASGLAAEGAMLAANPAT